MGFKPLTLTLNFSRLLFLIPMLLFLSSASMTCDKDCISVEQNTSENVIMIKLEGTERGDEQLLLFNKKNEVVLSEDIQLQNERTIYYIDLNTNDLPSGEYTIEFPKLKRKKNFAIK